MTQGTLTRACVRTSLRPEMRARILFFSVLLAAVTLEACGGGSVTTTPDESGDFDPTAGGMSGRIVEMPTGLDGTQWRWVEAHCTEGPLDLASRGFSQTLRISQEDPAQAGGALRLTYDQQYANEQCAQTVIQRVSPPPTPGELQVDEVLRVAVPPTPECFGRPEQPRPGEVRRAGNRLEVLVQRSNWCNGFEVRMVYEPQRQDLLENDQIARRFAALFSLGDADRLATLFAETGSLLEPFTVTDTGDPYRHDGRQAVRTWFTETFAGTPWRAMRISEMAAADQPHTTVAQFEYMDPRLVQPVRGRVRLTVAAGEIFEAHIELLDNPVMTPEASSAAPSSAAPASPAQPAQ